MNYVLTVSAEKNFSLARFYFLLVTETISRAIYIN